MVQQTTNLTLQSSLGLRIFSISGGRLEEEDSRLSVVLWYGHAAAAAAVAVCLSVWLHILRKLRLRGRERGRPRMVWRHRSRDGCPTGERRKEAAGRGAIGHVRRGGAILVIWTGAGSGAERMRVCRWLNFANFHSSTFHGFAQLRRSCLFTYLFKRDVSISGLDDSVIRVNFENFAYTWVTIIPGKPQF